MAIVSPQRPPVFNLPNQLTAMRLGLGVVLFVLISLQAWVWCILVFAAAYLFYRSQLWAGLACAWGMTFLDTVDGKLARVTATSSNPALIPTPVATYASPATTGTYAGLYVGLSPSTRPTIDDFVIGNGWPASALPTPVPGVSDNFNRALSGRPDSVSLRWFTQKSATALSAATTATRARLASALGGKPRARWSTTR